MFPIRLALCAAGLVGASQAFAGTVTTDGADLVIKTKGGLEVETTDNQFSFKIGGRLQADFDTFDGLYTDNGNRADASYLRRSRLEISGKAYGVWAYDLAVELNDTDTPIKEASISYMGLDPVTIKVGRFDPDFGLENAISSKWTTGIERSAVTELAPWVNDRDDGLGAQVRGTRGMFYGSAGILRPTTNEDSDGKGANNYNLRLVFAPMARSGKVLHFGLSYAYNDAESVDGRIRTRLGVRGVSETDNNGNRQELAPNTDGAFDRDSAASLEFAYATGPFSLQSEYLRRQLEVKPGTKNHDRDATGYYGQLAYTLTGEARGYKLDGGKFDQIKPQNKHFGAWEIFYRYDHLNVREHDLLDNTAKVHTVGVNWYANDAVKISANYVRATSDGFSNAVGDQDGDALALRAQYVF